MTSQVTRHLIYLPAAADAPVEAVGRKAHTLAVLASAGMPVPKGAVLASPWVESASDAELRATLTELWDRLTPPFAVRSSGVDEDTEEQSFAGLYETVLSIEDPEDLVSAVRKVAGSGESERVSSYSGESGGVAVLIQEMVPADAAGVAFTADPVSGERDVIVVSSVSGLGERLVSGEADPDEWEVRGRHVQARRTPESSLEDVQVVMVADLASNIAAHFDAPQDIEWAIAGDRVFLLQSRPITGLPEVEPREPEMTPPEEGYWVLDGSHYPSPMSPMGASFYLPALESGASEAFRSWGLLVDRIENKAIGWRVYLRMVPAGGKEGGPTPPWWLMGILARIVPPIRRQAKKAEDAFETGRLDSVIERWWDEWRGEFKESITQLNSVRLEDLSDNRLLDHFDDTISLVERGERIHFELFPPYMVAVAELIQFCEAELGWQKTKATELLGGLSAMTTEPARRLREVADTARSRSATAQLLDHEDITLKDLRAADDVFAEKLDDYIDEFGMRATAYDVISPTLGEQDHLILSEIRSEANYDPREVEERQRRDRETALTEARRALSGDHEKSERFNEMAAWVEKVYPVREDNIFFTDNAPLGLVRLAALEIGRRLHDRGLIDDPEHVFFLTVEEARDTLSEGTERHDVINRRRGEREWALRHAPPQSFGEDPGPPPDMRAMPSGVKRLMGAVMFFMEQDLDATAGDGMSGTPASAGTYTGPARVVLTEHDFDKVRAGDVLVCPITTPAWSILFGRIGGLVTDTGGLLSHSAIVAREHGIPAVVGAGSATTEIQDGQKVTVDGTTGQVEIID